MCLCFVFRAGLFRALKTVGSSALVVGRHPCADAKIHVPGRGRAAPVGQQALVFFSEQAFFGQLVGSEMTSDNLMI